MSHRLRIALAALVVALFGVATSAVTVPAQAETTHTLTIFRGSNARVPDLPRPVP